MPRRLLEDVTVQLVHETGKAWLLNDGKTQEWFPKAWGELSPNTDGTFTLTSEEQKLIEKGFL